MFKEMRMKNSIYVLLIYSIFLTFTALGAGTYVKGPALIEGTTSTVTAAGTTTLTKDSQSLQQFTGVTTQTVTLPDATTIPNGRKIYLFNRSTGAVTINYFGGALAETLAGGQWVISTLYDNSGSAGVWDFASSPGAAATAITSLTGDVTATGPGAAAAVIPAGTINNTRMSNVPTATFKGRVTAGTGVPEDLTGTQATTLLDAFTSGLKGLAPASGGGSINFLRADGTWAPPGAAAGFTIGSLITSGTANGVIYEDATNMIAESSDFQFDGASLILGNETINAHITTPSNPSAGFVKLYFKIDDNLYKLTSAGVETQIGAGGGGLTIGGAITGGTANRILYEGAGNVLAESASLAFDGTTLTGPTNFNMGSGTLSQIRQSGTTVMEWRGSGINYVAFNVPLIDNVGTTNFGAEAGANAYPFLTSYMGIGGLTIGVPYGASRAANVPNYELDVRGGAGDSTIQLSTTLSGSASTDGSIIYQSNTTADLVFHNQENADIVFAGLGGGSNVPLSLRTGGGFSSIQTKDIWPFSNNTYYLGSFVGGNTAPFKAGYINFIGMGYGSEAHPTETTGTIKVKTGTPLTIEADQVFLPNGSASVPILANEVANPNSGIYFTGAGSAFGVGITKLGTQFISFTNPTSVKIDVAGTYGELAHNGTTQIYWDSSGAQLNTFGASAANQTFGRYGGALYPFRQGHIGVDGLALGSVLGAGIFTPNYLLDIRGGAGNATMQLSNTASGISPTDGVKFEFDGANFLIDNQEGGSVEFIADSTVQLTTPDLEIVAVTGSGSFFGMQADVGFEAQINIRSGDIASGGLQLVSRPTSLDAEVNQTENAPLSFWANNTKYWEISNTNGQLGSVVAGAGLAIKEGSNARQDTCTLVAGTCTINNTTVAATDRIYCTGQVSGGVPGGLNVTSRTAATSYVVTSTSVTDTSDIACLLVGAL
jgi:hypothetical protein